MIHLHSSNCTTACVPRTRIALGGISLLLSAGQKAGIVYLLTLGQMLIDADWRICLFKICSLVVMRVSSYLLNLACFFGKFWLSSNNCSLYVWTGEIIYTVLWTWCNSPCQLRWKNQNNCKIVLSASIRVIRSIRTQVTWRPTTIDLSASVNRFTIHLADEWWSDWRNAEVDCVEHYLTRVSVIQ